MYQKIEVLCWQKKIFFSIPILPIIKIYLSIFIYEKKLFVFYSVPLFSVESAFALRL